MSVSKHMLNKVGVYFNSVADLRKANTKLSGQSKAEVGLYIQRFSQKNNEM